MQVSGLIKSENSSGPIVLLDHSLSTVSMSSHVLSSSLRLKMESLRIGMRIRLEMKSGESFTTAARLPKLRRETPRGARELSRYKCQFASAD